MILDHEILLYHRNTYLLNIILVYIHNHTLIPSLNSWGGPERMGPRPPPWVPLLKSYGSSILSTSFGSKTVNNTSSLGLGGTKT